MLGKFCGVITESILSNTNMFEMIWINEPANPIQPTIKPAVNKLKQKYFRIIFGRYLWMIKKLNEICCLFNSKLVIFFLVSSVLLVSSVHIFDSLFSKHAYECIYRLHNLTTTAWNYIVWIERTMAILYNHPITIIKSVAHILICHMKSLHSCTISLRCIWRFIQSSNPDRIMCLLCSFPLSYPHSVQKCIEFKVWYLISFTSCQPLLAACCCTWQAIYI